jgi:hypothetical protein
MFSLALVHVGNSDCIKSLTQRFEEIGSSIWQLRPSDSIFIAAGLSGGS